MAKAKPVKNRDYIPVIHCRDFRFSKGIRPRLIDICSSDDFVTLLEEAVGICIEECELEKKRPAREEIRASLAHVQKETADYLITLSDMDVISKNLVLERLFLAGWPPEFFENLNNSLHCLHGAITEIEKHLSENKDSYRRRSRRPFLVLVGRIKELLIAHGIEPKEGSRKGPWAEIIGYCSMSVFADSECEESFNWIREWNRQKKQ